MQCLALGLCVHSALLHSLHCCDTCWETELPALITPLESLHSFHCSHSSEKQWIQPVEPWELLRCCSVNEEAPLRLGGCPGSAAWPSVWCLTGQSLSVWRETHLSAICLSAPTCDFPTGEVNSNDCQATMTTVGARTGVSASSFRGPTTLKTTFWREVFFKKCGQIRHLKVAPWRRQSGHAWSLFLLNVVCFCFFCGDRVSFSCNIPWNATATRLTWEVDQYQDQATTF